MDRIRSIYFEMKKWMLEMRMCFLYDVNYIKLIWDDIFEEREKFWEDFYVMFGFLMWLCNYKEIFVDQKVNDFVSEFVMRKIKERVNDLWIVDKFILKNYGMLWIFLIVFFCGLILILCKGFGIR